MLSFFEHLSKLSTFSIELLRVAISFVMVWIGFLKVARYEAESIVPFVANSPLMRFFYRNGKDYKAHQNREVDIVPENIAWHKSNRTYTFSRYLGLVIISIGIVVLSGIWYPWAGIFGGLLATGMSFVTLSFLISTPETWVQIPQTNIQGFPWLSGSGRLIIKDVIMAAAGLVCASDSAGQLLRSMR